MKRSGKKCLSLLLTFVMLLGMLPTTTFAAAPSGTITAYMYYKVDGQVPADRNNKVQYNDTTQSNYGPSGDNTPMLAVEIDVDALLNISEQANSPVEFGDPTGRYPEWYFRPVSADDDDVDAFWDAVQQCMTPDSRAALAATGMGDNFVCYMLKRNGFDTQGYYVHMDGILNVSTEDDTDVYVCELYDENEAYIGGLVTDSTKSSSEHPTFEKVYDVYEAHFGMPSNTTWTRDANGAYATYTGSDGNRYRITVYQTNGGGTLYKPHESSEISYKMKDSNYYIALFGMDREAIPYTVTYTDGLDDRVAFRDEVYTGLYFGAVTPGFTGGTPEDPQQKLIFTGWSPAVKSTVTEDITYVAQWEEEKFTVTWLDDNGTELEVDRNVVSGTVPSYDRADPTKAGDAQYSYEFIGWSPAVAPVNGADQVYTAVYRPVLKSYTVTWVNDDGTVLEKDENVDYGTLPTYNDKSGTTAALAAAKNTSRYTYRFAGWNPEVDFVTGDITYKATYTQSTNTYTVTWIDHNGNVLDTDTVVYGDKPAYTETEPSRIPTTQYTYTFNGWKNINGIDSTVYASNGNFPIVTENVTYRAQYDSVRRNYTVTLKLYLDNVLVDSTAVHGTDLIPYISADNGNTLIASKRITTGTYVVGDVPNGTYGIYNAAGNRICDQIIVVENDDVAKECHYYTVTYMGNGADSGVPAAKAYHLGDAVTVKAAPRRAGYIFKGWKLNDGTVLQPNGALTAGITQAYTLTAQWADTVDIKVNVHLDHETDNQGRDVNPEKDDVTIELVWRPVDDSAPWLEVPNTVRNLDSVNHNGFNYNTTLGGTNADEVIQTVYTASAVTYSNVEGDNRKFSVTFDKTNYVLDTTKGTGSSGITAQKGADGNWTIDLYLKYATTNFDLTFSVEMDRTVPAALYPDAVIAKILYWDGDSWEIISQHDNGKPGVNVPINAATGKGVGKYSVWQMNTEDEPVPYGYRFEVSAFVYGGQIVPYIPAKSTPASYTDGTYTAEMQPVIGGKQYGSWSGAYYNADEKKQSGTLTAVIDVDSYKVTVNGNGGTVNGSAVKIYDDLIKMPDVSSIVPVHSNTAYVFDGYDWYEDADNNGVADNSTIVSAISAGTKLSGSYVLVARWKSPWTVKGDIIVDATYLLNGEIKTIQDADCIKSVTVLLQYAPIGSTVFTTKQTKSVDIIYDQNGNTKSGIGRYEFTNVSNDGGTWRVHLLNHNYTTAYRNENVSDFTAETGNLNSPCIALDVAPKDDVAKVDVKMTFAPDLFNLYFKVDASAIGAGHRPTKAEVLVLYDDKETSDSPRDWAPISQMQSGGIAPNFTYTGKTVDVGIEDSYLVWMNHPAGYLYDYAISLQSVDASTDLAGKPYSIEYNGSAEYLANGGYKTQTQLLTAKLLPKSYPIKYYLEYGNTVELTGMTVSSHTWSYDTDLKAADGSWKDAPTRSGWVFTGWVDEDKNPVTCIDAEVAAETKLYATWEEDSWKDSPNGDSPTGGDGIPDSQQIRIVYVTDGHGTTSPLGEIVTIIGGNYTNAVVVGDGSTAAALTGYGYDGWTYEGSSDSSDNATATLNVIGTKLIPTITNADGGNTYTFKVSFAMDNWKDDPNGGDAPTGGDGIPDKYQAMVEFHSANTAHGTVSGNIYQVITFADNATSGTVTPSLTGVSVNASENWALDFWIKDSGTDKLQNAQVEQPINNVTGGTVIRFYANFAIDEWKDTPNGDAPTGGDGIPDYRQALVTYIPAANGRGTVTGKDAVQVFTLPGNSEMMDITPKKDDLTVTANSGYAFDYWGDLEGFWGTAGAKLTNDQPFLLHENVRGGVIITYVAHFDTDNWNADDGSESGGDNVPDSQQILIRYTSNDTAKGTVSPALEVITLVDGEKKGPENISGDKINGSTAAASAGNVFINWNSNRSNVSFTASDMTVDPTIYGARGGEIYTFTAAFDTDVVGGENGGDGTPDMYQKEVTFKVVNGAWDDSTADDQTVYVTLIKDGKWDVNGSAALTAPAVGQKPDSGYKAGSWDLTPPATVTGVGDETYVYTYAALEHFTVTVNYLEEGTGTQLKTSETVSAVEGVSYDVSDKILESLTYDAKNYVKFSVIGDSVSGTADGNKNITVYYAIDELIDTDKDPDPTLPGDSVPDMYQKQITFKVVNGAWNDDSDDNITVCVTLIKDGEWDINGSAALTAPAVGQKPDSGYKAGSWDLTPPDTVTGVADETYTYTYAALENFTVTVNYLEEGTGTHLKPSETVLVVEGDSYDVSDKIPENLTYDAKNFVKFSVIGAPVSGTANGNKHITVYYEIDELIDTDKDPDPTLPGDGIPDMYQKKIIFKVVNGAWNDGTTADQTVYVTLTKDGEWDVNGSAALTAPAVGQKPDSGYKAGSWNLTPPATVTGVEDESYVYTYVLLDCFAVTVNYLEERNGTQLRTSETVTVLEGDSYDVSNLIPEEILCAATNYVKFSVNGDSISGTADGNKNITVYYVIDELTDKDKDPDPILPGDGIPDMYQKKIIFKVVNGAWNDGSDDTLVICVTLMKDGEWDVNGSAILIAPMVGRKPNNGFRAGNWDVVPPAIVRGTNEEVYTYTYDDILPILPIIPITGSATLIKVDAADSSTTLSNVVFNLYKANGTFMGTYITGPDGTVTVGKLPAGQYYWVEMRPAEGYMLDRSKHEFTVFGGTNSVISVSNTRTPLPEVFSGEHYAYVIGYSDGLVHPESNITRAEVATIFFRLLDDSTRAKYMTKTNNFADVEKGMWFNTAVSTMAAMGIVNGYPDGNFHPDAYITRAEFAAIAARFDSKGNTTGASFSDIYGHWAQKEINLAYNNGWILGYEDGSFKPNQNIVRAEAMTLINRVLQRVPERKSDLLDNMITWPDNMDTSKWYYLAVQEATNSHDYNRKKNGYEYWTELRKNRDWAALER